MTCLPVHRGSGRRTAGIGSSISGSFRIVARVGATAKYTSCIKSRRVRNVSFFSSSVPAVMWSWMRPRIGLPSAPVGDGVMVRVRSRYSHPMELSRQVAGGQTDRQAGRRAQARRSGPQVLTGRDNVLVVGMHDVVALSTAELVLGQVQVDLIAVKVGVEGRAVDVVHPDCPLPVQDPGAVRHHARLVQRRLAVREHQVPVLQVAVDDLAGVPCLGPGAGGGGRARHQRLGDRLALLLRPGGQHDQPAPLVLHGNSTRVVVGPVDDQLPQLGHVVGRHPLGEGQLLRKVRRNADLTPAARASGSEQAALHGRSFRERRRVWSAAQREQRHPVKTPVLMTHPEM